MSKYLNDIKKQVLPIFFKYVSKDGCVIFVFGSFAQKKIYPSSDIDIGLACGEPLENSKLAKIKQELKKVRILRDIDVVDFSSLRSKNFLKSALKEVAVWHQTGKSKIYLANLKKRIKD